MPARRLAEILHPKVTIFVEGGNIQEIMANNPNIQIEVVDYDNNPMTVAGREAKFAEVLKKCPYMITF